MGQRNETVGRTGMWWLDVFILGQELDISFILVIFTLILALQ